MENYAQGSVNAMKAFFKVDSRETFYRKILKQYVRVESVHNLMTEWNKKREKNELS